MLVSDHEKYHKMQPNQVKWTGTEIAKIDVIRPTSAEGEQVQLTIPIYRDDSREEITDRANFLFSIVQDRMEDHNKAVQLSNQKHYAEVRERLLKKIGDYKEKNHAPPKKLLNALGRVELIIAGVDEELMEDSQQGAKS